MLYYCLMQYYWLDVILLPDAIFLLATRPRQWLGTPFSFNAPAVLFGPFYAIGQLVGRLVLLSACYTRFLFLRLRIIRLFSSPLYRYQ